MEQQTTARPHKTAGQISRTGLVCMLGADSRLAANDEPESYETATQYAQRRSAEHDRRALDLQMSHPLTSRSL